jgi:hypothetical protein
MVSCKNLTVDTQTLSGAYPAGGNYGVIHERAKTTGTGLRRPLSGRENQNRKSAVLTEFIPATGFNRKFAVGIPGGEGKAKLLRLNGNLAKARITRLTRKSEPVKNAATRKRRLYRQTPGVFQRRLREAPGSPHKGEHRRPSQGAALWHHSRHPAEAGSDKPFHGGTAPQGGTEKIPPGGNIR